MPRKNTHPTGRTSQTQKTTAPSRFDSAGVSQHHIADHNAGITRTIMDSPGPDSEDSLPVPGEDARAQADPSLISRHQLAERCDPHTAPHTCRHCAKLVLDLRRQQANYVYRKAGTWRDSKSTGFDVGAAKTAASEGCVLYSQLCRAKNLDEIQGALERKPIMAISRMCDRATVHFSLSPNPKGLLGGLGGYDMYTVPGQHPWHRFLGYRLPPNLVPNSDISYTRVRQWLNACQQTHSKCRVFNKPYMPKRVLEVVDGPTGLSVRLVMNPKQAPYIALSYCWGGDQPVELTKGRLVAYSESIPLKQLSQTILDALIVTHRVGQRYLWVDALCIVQDDKEDQAHEISQMHSIYRGSLVTIAAAAANTSKDGFLHPRRGFRATRLTVRVEDNTFAEVVVMPTIISQSASTSPYRLYTRGWTFQENQLSTRVLAYGDRELVFQCLESRRCDGGHEYELGEHGPDHDPTCSLLRKLDPGNRSMANRTHPDGWGEIVRVHSGRQLSNPEDKLPAVAALAEEYRRTQPVTRYLAGLWEEDLLLQCLWSTSSGPGSLCRYSRPSGYRAPSWSWASVEGSISSYCGREETEHAFTCELLEAETTLRSQGSPFAEVTGGFLRVRAKLRQVVWSNTSIKCGGGGRAAEDSAAKPEFQHSGGTDDRLNFTVDVVSEWPANTDVSFWCIEICTFYKYGFLHGNGLLLEDVSCGPTTGGAVSNDERMKVFRRAGKITFGDSVHSPYWFNARQFDWKEITIV